jgi:hypothetical protein
MEKSGGTFVGTSCGEELEMECQGSTPCDLRPRSLPPEPTMVGGLIRVLVFTSHREDVHLRVGHLAKPISRGPNES